MPTKKNKKAEENKYSKVLIVSATILATVSLIWSLLAFLGIYKESFSPMENFLAHILGGCLFFILGLFLFTRSKKKSLSKKIKFFGGLSIVFGLLFILPGLQIAFNQLTASSVFQQQASTATKVYSNDVTGITFKYPTTWNVTLDGKDPRDSTIIMKNKLAKFRTIGPYSTTRKTLEQLVEAEHNYMNLDTFTEEAEVTLNGQQYHKEILFEKEPPHVLKAVELLTIKNGKFYYFRYSNDENNFDKDLPEANIIFNSLVIR